MELNESLAPFLHQEKRYNESKLFPMPPIRIGCLTVSPDLNFKIRQALRFPRTMLTTIQSIESFGKFIESELCDVAIVDIERSDQWPAVTFQQFDETAANFPIIVLCSRQQDVTKFLWEARYVQNIFPYSSIEDPRFFCLVYAAALRSEIVERTGFEDS